MKILIASANINKVKEISSILEGFDVTSVSLQDFPPMPDVPETGNTLEENSLIKAKAYHEITGLPVIADDTGLFVDALKGEPGVYSARYAGDNATYDDNCNKLIAELQSLEIDHSLAYFKTVICYLSNLDTFQFFDGIVEGKVITEKRGNNGFGYDPVFIPVGYHRTFAELTDDEKNSISHRALAVKNFVKNFTV